MSQHHLKHRKVYSKCCPICLAEVRGRHEKRLPCQHILHKKCFGRLKSKGHWKCPTCRRPFTKQSKTCSYESKADTILDEIVEGQNVSSTQSLYRRPYWDHLSFLPPLTPPGSDRSLRDEHQSRRERDLDSPQRSQRCSRRESRRIERARESPSGRQERERSDTRRRTQREARNERQTRLREQDSKESDDEFYQQVVDNFTDEPFFRFFSSNLLHEHEQREGLTCRSSRQVSPEAALRSDRRE